MQAVSIQNAPQFLNTNDQAMWVLGYNEAVQKMQCTGCAVQQGTHVPMGAVVKQIQEPQKFTGDSEMRRAFEIEYGQGWTDPDWRKEVGTWASAWHKATAAARELAAVQQVATHPDDMAVDALAAAMKAKLAKQRAKGYAGWDTDCTQERLSELLRGHVDKGDPVDVANFCAFLLARGEAIAAVQQAVQPDDFKRKVYEALGVGELAPEFALFVNIENLQRRTDCLDAIEREFFTVETPPNEEEGDTESGEECLLNWGASPEQYVKQFAQALDTHSTQQGLDAGSPYKQAIEEICVGGVRTSLKDELLGRAAEIAAQAKQGEQASA